MHKNRQKVGNCAGYTIPGEKVIENLCTLPIDKFGVVWYNEISGRLGRGRPAEYLSKRVNEYSAVFIFPPIQYF